MIKERHRLRIVGLDEEGAGVGRLDGLELRVPFALPGDEVEAEVEHRSPHREVAWGRLVEVVSPSAARVEASCRAFGRCGGCVLQRWDYARQVEWKRALVEEALARAGVVARVEPCVPSPRPLRYRNRAKLVFARRGEQVVLGAYAPRSHEVVDLAGCAVVEEPLDEVAVALASLARAIPVYNEADGTGVLRYALLRVNHCREVLATLVVAEEHPELDALARALREARPEVIGVVRNLQPSRGNALLGHVAPDRLLDGAPHLEERAAGVTLRLSARSFFQANRWIAEQIYSRVVEAAALVPGERAVDVYTGVGGIALALATTGATVVGIESNPAAVEDARAAAAGMSHLTFTSGDAASLLAEVDNPAEVVVLNPPRRGASPSVLRAAAHLRPRTLLYVSCSPATLARDLAALLPLGYLPRRITPHDMLPHTPHVEVLAELTR